MRLSTDDFHLPPGTCRRHLRIALPMGFQLSIMCIGLIVMQGALLIHRATIQGMGKPRIPFLACMIELVCRVGATFILAHYIGYVGICFPTPIAWFCACLLLVPMYRKTMRALC